MRRRRRKGGVQGKGVDFGGCGSIKKKRTTVFFPAIPRYSAVTSSGKRPAGVLSSVRRVCAERGPPPDRVAAARTRRRALRRIFGDSNGKPGGGNSRRSPFLWHP